MSIVFNGPKTTFVLVTFVHYDAIDRTKLVFEYPKTFNFATFEFFYLCINNIITIIRPSSFSLIPNTNKFKLIRTNFYPQVGQSFKMLVSSNNERGIDFKDKQGQTGTVYTYDSFVFHNGSKYNKLNNTYVTSENLVLGFNNDYPTKFRHIKYTNSCPSRGVHVDTSGVGILNLVGFFNNAYVGQIDYSGNFTPSFVSSKEGILEIINLGILEFSLSVNGPWFTVLNIPVITGAEVVTVHVRCGQIITGLMRVLNSIKIISTEAI
jgi:hypothetical protein